MTPARDTGIRQKIVARLPGRPNNVQVDGDHTTVDGESYGKFLAGPTAGRESQRQDRVVRYSRDAKGNPTPVLGSELSTYRLRAGLTVDELATAAAVPLVIVQAADADDVAPSESAHRASLAAVLEAKPSEIFPADSLTTPTVAVDAIVQTGSSSIPSPRRQREPITDRAARASEHEAEQLAVEIAERERDLELLEIRADLQKIAAGRR